MQHGRALLLPMPAQWRVQQQPAGVRGARHACSGNTRRGAVALQAVGPGWNDDMVTYPRSASPLEPAEGDVLTLRETTARIRDLGRTGDAMAARYRHHPHAA